MSWKRWLDTSPSPGEVGCEVKSQSYKPCECGSDCDYLDKGGVCWGQVSAVDEIELLEEYLWAHTCQGHSGVYHRIYYGTATGYEEEPSVETT